MQTRNVAVASYLPRAYKNSEESLYSHTIFKILRDLIGVQIQKPRILDLGCADQRSFKLLSASGLHIHSYCGVDYNKDFQPTIEADIREASKYFDKIDFVPNVILITDVLEHFENGADDIQKFLRSLSSKVNRGTKIYISVPQMYRLDRFKLSHLAYPEHTVRLTLTEWESLIQRDFFIEQRIGVGYISVIPYLIMFFRFYCESGWTGRIFKTMRSRLSKSVFVRKLDYLLSIKIRASDKCCALANSALFVCVKGDGPRA